MSLQFRFPLEEKDIEVVKEFNKRKPSYKSKFKCHQCKGEFEIIFGEGDELDIDRGFTSFYDVCWRNYNKLPFRLRETIRIPCPICKQDSCRVLLSKKHLKGKAVQIEGKGK